MFMFFLRCPLAQRAGASLTQSWILEWTLICSHVHPTPWHPCSELRDTSTSCHATQRGLGARPPGPLLQAQLARPPSAEVWGLAPQCPFTQFLILSNTALSFYFLSPGGAKLLLAVANSAITLSFFLSFIFYFFSAGLTILFTEFLTVS